MGTNIESCVEYLTQLVEVSKQIFCVATIRLGLTLRIKRNEFQLIILAKNQTENFVINAETSKNFSACTSSLCGFLERCWGSRKGEIHNFSLSSFCFHLFSRLASPNSRFYGSAPDTLGRISILPTWTVFTLCPPRMGSGCACLLTVVFPMLTTVAGTQKCLFSEYVTSIWERQTVSPNCVLL